jgi:hypothetical protein
MSNTDDSPDDPAEESTNNLINDAIKFFKDIIDKNGTQLSGGKFTFPLDLDEQEMIRFEIFKEYKFDRREKGETDTLATIVLNMLAQAVESGGAAVAVGGLIGSVLGPAAGTHK